LSDRVPSTDAFVVNKLKAAGAVLLGEIECTEFCLGGPATDGLVPHSRNPWNTDRYAGGSSIGAGVALSARMIPLKHGSDTGRSIRIPAAYCGVAGHKPTYGRVTLPGLFPLSSSLNYAGPLAVCSADCAMLLDAISDMTPRILQALNTNLHKRMQRSMNNFRDFESATLLTLLRMHSSQSQCSNPRPMRLMFCARLVRMWRLWNCLTVGIFDVQYNYDVV
jgi:Asp-tRNA(Asn)/Glu-tRNA(Gln) amidotransferase A subunit family amidase